ncbi:hypothetical protein [Neolewinella xylanilytica]|uniref:hypothetical protein n=1 Tax=Neolewinella xylanilytica TaxID=1514080 RepID=UPI00147501AD|nr:hypothetical protein [Neolewinella xylanilytica]
MKGLQTVELLAEIIYRDEDLNQLVCFILGEHGAGFGPEGSSDVLQSTDCPPHLS